MKPVASLEWMTTEQDKRISETVEREQARLRNFIRRRVTDPGDADDILQDVFYELVEAYRLMKPIEQVGAWMFRVARNRITDLFRKKRPDALRDGQIGAAEDGEFLMLEELLPSAEAGPEESYARTVLLEELEEALDELPAEQREIFIAHEIEGRSYKDLAAEKDLSVNTLLSRKHYAVVHLRERLQQIYDEFLER
ncbi:MAG: polymerase, sigma-24 subunit, subfamily [Acidobacteriaceae bacterium]|jgi:RNA polymerase sigma factor (sigma-70 family)|nr:polymerase, sigma-24 subunit, subfamily [Acidobacteriaceae bacterium]